MEARLAMLASMALGVKTERILLCLLADATESSASAHQSEASLRILRHILSSCDRLTCFGYKFLLFILEWVPTILTGHYSFGRFTHLSAEARSAHFNALRTSRFYIRRALFKAILTPVWISHYTRTDVQKALGYDSQELTSLYQKAAQHE